MMKISPKMAAILFGLGAVALGIAMFLPGPLLLLSAPASFLFYPALITLAVTGAYLNIQLWKWLVRLYAPTKRR